GNGAGRLDDEVETALVRRGAAGDVDGVVRTKPARQLQLGFANAEGDHGGGCEEAREHDREGAHGADADHADPLARPRVRTQEPAEHDRARLDQHRRFEAYPFRQSMDDTPWRQDQLAEPAAAGEAELVVVLAEVGIP